MGARDKDLGSVTFLGGSMVEVVSSARELMLELSGMRDCGGVRERLESLEPG